MTLSASFKSNFIRDHVIEVKRNVGQLNRNMILGLDAGDEVIYLNEPLPLETHKLHMAAKQHKAKIGWVGFLWVQNSKILARKGRDKPKTVFQIKTSADLKLMS